MTTPPLLRKMMETPVGELVIYGDRIVEPMTGCVVGYGFPSKEKALAAATAMNQVADWFGVIKTRAEGGRPNCQDELERIVREHGGSFGNGATTRTEERCASVVKQCDNGQTQD